MGGGVARRCPRSLLCQRSAAVGRRLARPRHPGTVAGGSGDAAWGTWTSAGGAAAGRIRCRQSHVGLAQIEHLDQVLLLPAACRIVPGRRTQVVPPDVLGRGFLPVDAVHLVVNVRHEELLVVLVPGKPRQSAADVGDETVPGRVCACNALLFVGLCHFVLYQDLVLLDGYRRRPVDHHLEQALFSQRAPVHRVLHRAYVDEAADGRVLRLSHAVDSRNRLFVVHGVVGAVPDEDPCGADEVDAEAPSEGGDEEAQHAAVRAVEHLDAVLPVHGPGVADQLAVGGGSCAAAVGPRLHPPLAGHVRLDVAEGAGALREQDHLLARRPGVLEEKVQHLHLGRLPRGVGRAVLHALHDVEKPLRELLRDVDLWMLCLPRRNLRVRLLGLALVVADVQVDSVAAGAAAPVRQLLPQPLDEVVRAVADRPHNLVVREGLRLGEGLRLRILVAQEVLLVKARLERGEAEVEDVLLLFHALAAELLVEDLGALPLPDAGAKPVEVAQGFDHLGPHKGVVRLLALRDRLHKDLLELLEVPEPPGLNPLDHVVVLHEVVLQRRARQREPAPRLDLHEALAPDGLGVLDAVRLVRHDDFGNVPQVAKGLAAGLLEEPRHHVVGDEEHAPRTAGGLPRPFAHLGPAGAVVLREAEHL
mmetsp:Transcript_27973/g.66458  ORF Transcript_27973/g.66458 Transcript_27973/m.66458 type:complete len:646 (-) Transcript_27973:396-2333(-)